MPAGILKEMANMSTIIRFMERLTPISTTSILTGLLRLSLTSTGSLQILSASIQLSTQTPLSGTSPASTRKIPWFWTRRTALHIFLCSPSPQGYRSPMPTTGHPYSHYKILSTRSKTLSRQCPSRKTGKLLPSNYLLIACFLSVMSFAQTPNPSRRRRLW